jgi:F-type H+-transporting ATPase subunit epsilon
MNAATRAPPMRLKVLLPFEVFVDEHDVSRIVAESPHGAFGLLPRRLDCVAALVPGILIYETPAHGEVCLAVDEGVLVKTGASVLVSVRRALRGVNLGTLRADVASQFLAEDVQARTLRAAMANVENRFLRQFASFEHG